MNKRSGSLLVGVTVGLIVAAWSYSWLTDPSGRAERQREIDVVTTSRNLLSAKLGTGDLEFVDPVAPRRSVGKVYIYPIDGGWEISGFYRRDDDDKWHAYLASVDASLELSSLKVQDNDPQLAARADADPVLEVVAD